MRKWIWVFFVLVSSNCFADMILLKSGKTIEAKIVEKTDKAIKVDVQGVTVTYWMDEIDKINGEVAGMQNQASNQQEDSPSANELYQQAKNSPNLSISSIDLVHAGSGVIDEEIQAALFDNQEAINLFKKAFQQKSDDIILGKMDQIMGHPAYWDDMHLYALILAQTYQYMANGQFAEAEENLLTAAKFLNRLANEKFGFFVNLTQSICFDQTIPLITKVVKSNSLSRQFYQSFLEQFKLLASKDILDVLQGEKEWCLKGIRKMEEEAKKERDYNADFWSDIYKNVDSGFIDFYKYQVEAFIKNDPEIYEQKVKKIKAQLEERSASFLSTESMQESQKFMTTISGGDASVMANFILYQYTSLRKAINYYYIGSSKGNILTTAIAIKLFQLDNKKLPQSLDELVPKYLSKIPEDSFNNLAPLQYKKIDTGYLLYSLGPDRVDQSGQIVFDSSARAKDTPGDIVFSFEGKPE